ncbi:MAG TPA: cation-translocating P-type ATPase [Burkholderiaceae bacterium]|nr:cation-translocating P-type ATPase [Burkholderiaceae bacterium]
MVAPPHDATLAAPLAALDDPLELARFTRVQGDGDRAVAESTLQLSGLHCAACAGEIESALRRVDGVIEAQVHYAASRASVRWQPGRTQASVLVEAVRRAGYEAVPDTLAAARALRAGERRTLLWRLFVAAFCSMQVMMLATPVYVAAPGTMEPDMAQLLHRSAWTLTLPVMLFSALPFFTSALRSLRNARLGMDVPVALGIAVAFVASSGAAFDPGGVFGHEVYFDSLTMLVSFLLGGRWLEARARHRAAEAIEALASGLPAVAWRLAADGSVQAVSALRLAPGDRVRVPVGESFPADGTLEGTAATEVDESLLTGESRPVPKPPGAGVVAGSGNRGVPVVMRVERVGADTRCEQIAALMREALTRRPEVARLADRWAAPFLAAVLLLALGAAFVWHQIDPARAVWVAVSVLIVTCPCALALATPAALLAATSGLARRGVLLRRVEAIETLARTGHVMLDKTGTVTEARPVLREARLLGAGDAAAQTALLESAAALAAWSTHPLSRALHETRPHGLGGAWQAVTEVAGCGLEATDAQGRRWRLGRPEWLGVDESVAGGAQVCFGPTGQARLALHFDEALRGDAAAAVRALQSEGLRITLLSGDAPARVSRLAQRLGIAECVAAATPERKLEAVRAAQHAGQVVAMVGDGINDAPVLAQADASFALAHGAEVARGAADAVLLSGRLGDVVHALQLARRTVRVMRQNLAWAALYNAACVPLALAGWLPPWAAGLGMAASSALVVGNAMRLAREA